MGVLGVKRLSPWCNRMEDELEALIKLDKWEKIARSAERRERRERRAMKLTVEPEDEDFNLPLYEEVVDQHEQGCNFDLRGGRVECDHSSSDSEEDNARPLLTGATNQVNMILQCQH